MFIYFKRNLLFFTFCFSFFFSTTYAFGQEISEKKENILAIANSLYSIDDRLVNGKYYIPKHHESAGYPYFKSDNWLNGTLFIKGIKYTDIPLKYNIEDDMIIIDIVFENKIAKSISMFNAFVDSLIINSQKFHNTDNFSSKNPIGFAELIYQGDSLSAYFKHSIEFLDVISDRKLYGKYSEPRKTLYFLEENSFFQINSKKTFLAYFENHKKEIRQFMRRNEIYFKKATTNQLIKLLRFSENL